MPRKRRVEKQQRYLTEFQWMELVYGPQGPSAFASKIERRAAWYLHRDAILPGFNAAQRPWAWWQFDAPESKRTVKKSYRYLDFETKTYREWEYEAPEDDVDYLERVGLLSDYERAIKKAMED